MGARLFIPGFGVVDAAVHRCHTAVREYDDRLSFGLNEETGDYCLFVALPRPHSEFWPPRRAIRGFGRDVPSVESVMRAVYEQDTLRNPDRLSDVIAHNERIKDAAEARSAEASEASAERMEHILRRAGMTEYSQHYRKVKSGERRLPNIGKDGL